MYAYVYLKLENLFFLGVFSEGKNLVAKSHEAHVAGIMYKYAIIPGADSIYKYYQRLMIVKSR